MEKELKEDVVEKPKKQKVKTSKKEKKAKKEKERATLKSEPLNRILLPILFFVFSIILEIANYLYMGMKDINGNIIVVPSYFLFDIAIILIISGFIYLVHNKIAMNIVLFLFLTVQFVIGVTNTTMYNVFGDILSFDLMMLGDEAIAAITVEFIDWGGFALNVCLFIAMATIIGVIQKKNKKKVSLKTFSTPIIVLAAFIMCQSVGFSLFSIQKANLTEASSVSAEIETSDVYLWDKFQFKIDAYKKFGYYGFYSKSIFDFLFDTEKVDIDEYKDYIDEGYVSGNSDAPLYGDNLIVILCESLDWYAIDPINTPTLYSMASGDNTVVLREFYARNRTNISEGIVMLGNMPKNSSTGDALNLGYNFDYSLPNLFKRSSNGENVQTSFFHDNSGSFYTRNKRLGVNGIGFDDLYFSKDYTGSEKFGGFGDWRSDLEFTSNLMDKFVPDEGRFLTYFTSVSTHGPYTSEKSGLSKYYEIFDNNYDEYSKWFAENESDKFTIPQNKTDFTYFRNYKAAFIDFDRTIENLINTLKEKNRYEDTTILMFADHNSYYYDLCYKVKNVSKKDFSNLYVQNIPVLIHSPKLTQGQGEQNYTFCNTYDLLPTICDLFGLESNKNLFQGYSIYSNDIQKSIFVSHLNGMFTNKMYSLNISEVYKIGEGISENEVSKFKKYANNYYLKQQKIETIYKKGINGNKKFA